MVRLSGIEPETHCLEGSCSIQLSYRRERKNKGYEKFKSKKQRGEIPNILNCLIFGRGGEIRTHGPLVPNQVRYRCATPRPKIRLK